MLPGMAVRGALPSDAAAIAALHVRSRQSAYRGLLPDAMLQRLSVEQRRQRWEQTIGSVTQTVLVADIAGHIAGYIAFGPSRDSDAQPTTGEVYSINLDPADWRHGYGTALLHAALEQLRETGFAEVSLWVLDGNTRAFSFPSAWAMRRTVRPRSIARPAGLSFTSCATGACSSSPRLEQPNQLVP